MMEIINNLLSRDGEAGYSILLLLAGIFGLAALGSLLWWTLGDFDSCSRNNLDNPYGLENRYDFTPVDADDLTRLEGVDPIVSSKLNRLGIYKLDQLTALSETQREQIGADFGLGKGVLDFRSEHNRQDEVAIGFIEWQSWDDKTRIEKSTQEGETAGFVFQGPILESTKLGRCTKAGYQFGEVAEMAKSNVSVAPSEEAIRNRAIEVSNWRLNNNIDAHPDADWIVAERELFIESCGNSVVIDRYNYFQWLPKDDKIVAIDIETRNELNRLGYVSAKSIVQIQPGDRLIVEEWFRHRKIPLDLDRLQVDLLDQLEDWPRVPTEEEIAIRASSLSAWRQKRNIVASELDDWLLAERELYISACGLSHITNRERSYQKGVGREAMPNLSDDTADELSRLGYPNNALIQSMDANDRLRLNKWFKARGITLALAFVDKLAGHSELSDSA